MKPRNFKQAAQASLDERWLPMSKAKSVDDMHKIFWDTECALCELQASRHGYHVFYRDMCCKCPLVNTGPFGSGDCCDEFWDWITANNKDNFKAAHKAALAMCKRLKEIVEG